MTSQDKMTPQEVLAQVDSRVLVIDVYQPLIDFMMKSPVLVLSRSARDGFVIEAEHDSIEIYQSSLQGGVLWYLLRCNRGGARSSDTDVVRNRMGVRPLFDRVMEQLAVS